MKRIHRSFTLLAGALIPSATEIILLCAVALLIRLGGEDDGTWAASEVADMLKPAAVQRTFAKLRATKG